MPRTTHPELHRSERIGWLRAAVLGANDGIVSTASLMVGVAAAGTGRGELLVTGIAGLVAGAMSMAAGEYVSVRSQSDTEHADLSRERAELTTQPALEKQELASIYVARGLKPELAARVAEQLMAHDALGAHARDELGISPQGSARPVQASFTSAASFAAGSALPILTALAVPGPRVVPDPDRCLGGDARDAGSARCTRRTRAGAPGLHPGGPAGRDGHGGHGGRRPAVRRGRLKLDRSRAGPLRIRDGARGTPPVPSPGRSRRPRRTDLRPGVRRAPRPSRCRSACIQSVIAAIEPPTDAAAAPGAPHANLVEQELTRRLLPHRQQEAEDEAHDVACSAHAAQWRTCGSVRCARRPRGSTRTRAGVGRRDRSRHPRARGGRGSTRPLDRAGESPTTAGPEPARIMDQNGMSSSAAPAAWFSSSIWAGGGPKSLAPFARGRPVPAPSPRPPRNTTLLATTSVV